MEVLILIKRLLQFNFDIKVGTKTLFQFIGYVLPNVILVGLGSSYADDTASLYALMAVVFAVIGGVALLKAVGFEKDDAEGKFVLAADAHAANLEVIKATLTKLEEGYNAYVQAGPGGAGP